MQLTKSKFVLAARGVQLDNGVTSPWTDFNMKHKCSFNVVSFYWDDSLTNVYEIIYKRFLEFKLQYFGGFWGITYYIMMIQVILWFCRIT